jgi:7,8-dihydropterin-6-yl-methyl-4-(beta-D-ribofuranosyl)aminobenzene 5'-phosphate synthase
MKRKVILTTVFLLLILQFTRCQVKDYHKYQGSYPKPLDDGITQALSVLIIYDNYFHTSGMESDWGYSILIKGLDKTILFDTGTKPKIFESNFKKLGIDANDIDEVFISHNHGDHTGGLGKILSMNPDIKVVVPETFEKSFFRIPETTSSSVELISGPVEICNDLYSSGILGTKIPEQALVLNTSKGLVIMTGCSHPGIIRMLEEIKATFGKDIYFVFGGFHLMRHSENEISDIIEEMKGMGIKKCGATHCTGKDQIEQFRMAFGENFVELGVGNTIVID